jgi:hypothetical protein
MTAGKVMMDRNARQMASAIPRNRHYDDGAALMKPLRRGVVG